MANRPQRRFWRICRLYFRRLRITVWFALFVLLSCLVYLNQVGLPGFVKRPLLQKLRDRGIDLQFSRIRLRWYEGIVADNVRFERADEPSSPQLMLGEVRLLFNFRALTRLKFQVDALGLRRGRLIWPIITTNQPPAQMTIERIQCDLRFMPDDQWALDNFKATFVGADIRLSGVISNASAVRDWKFVQENQPAIAATSWPERLRRFSETLKRISFSTPPELVLDVRGDARDLQSFGVIMLLAAPGATTPWGDVAQGRFTGRIFPAATNGMSHAELHLEAAGAQTPWVAITNFVLGLELVSFPSQTNLIEADLRLSARSAATRWGEANNARLGAHWVHAMPDPIPLSANGWLDCEEARTKWAGARQLQISGDLKRPSETSLVREATRDWGWWTNVQPYFLEGEARLTHLQVSNFVAESVAFNASWRAPDLVVSNLDVQLYGGRFDTAANLDVSSRALHLNLTSDFDPLRIRATLPTSAQQWLDRVSWNEPPRVKADLMCMLPVWTNRPTDWTGEVFPTVQLSGELNLPQGGVYQKKISISSASSHFVYSNSSWHLPDLMIRRPEGVLNAEHRGDKRTGDFYWRIASSVDVTVLRPFLDKQAQAGFDLFTFTQPPVIDAEIRGRYDDPARTEFNGHIAITNCTFRGEAITGVQTRLQYSNRVLQFQEPRIQCGTQHLSADGLIADFNAQLVYLTNGVSDADPMLIAHAIGPQVEEAIAPYRFLSPPLGRVSGAIPMHGEEGADLHFDLDGGPFYWWKFRLPHITGHVHWSGEQVTLSDVQADFYGGKAVGAAKFDLRPQKGTDFLFGLGTTNVQLHALMSDLSSETNHLEGWISGAISVTKANTEDWRTVNGYGETSLRDGLLWDIPLFGIFSPVLNGISPGLGNSRASAGTCSFVITNGVILSPDLDIRSTAMRLRYRGTVDLESRLNARVEAELLRDMWLVGPFVSTVFWPVTKMFEYKVTGTLEDPKTEPLFLVPKVLLMPFHPFRSLKGSKPQENTPPATNPPPTP